MLCLQDSGYTLWHLRRGKLSSLFIKLRIGTTLNTLKFPNSNPLVSLPSDFTHPSATMSTSNVAADLDAALELIKANPPSEKETIVALRKVHEEINEPNVVSELIKQVETLCDSALSVDLAFAHVSTLLQELQTTASHELRDPLNQLGYKWQGYRKVGPMLVVVRSQLKIS